jgi:hypothetical protein
MAVRSQTTVIEVKGTKQLVTRLELFQRNILAAQFDTGKKLMEEFKKQSQEIINLKKAEYTTGELGRSIVIDTNMSGKRSIVYSLKSNRSYSNKVHSGYPAYMERNITPRLLMWVAANLGKNAAKNIKRNGVMALGYPSLKRPYNAQVGMRFFDEPFARAAGQIPEEYYKAVDAARKRAKV